MQKEEIYHSHPPLRKFRDLPRPSWEISALDVLELASSTDLFCNKIRFLRRIPVDKIVVPISVDGNASVRDHQRSWRDVDECAA